MPSPFLRLMRPANIVTALADILAGAAVAGAWSVAGPFPVELGYLLLATIGLYGGGVVFNDVFDAGLDRIERPERPIPSGQITIERAALGGAALLVGGILAAGLVSMLSALIAGAVATLAVLYDKYAKHHPIAGPLVMGGCRAGNLLLGMSIISAAVPTYWYLSVIPLLFITDITLTSRGEVHGGNRRMIVFAGLLDLTVAGLLVGIARYTDFSLSMAWPFLLLWLGLNASGKVRALTANEPANIMRAVKLGVLSLIPLNATFAAGFLGWPEGMLVLLLLPLSVALARYFAVT